MIKLLLVDDHPSVREGTKVMFEEEQDFAVSAVSSGMEALELVKVNDFDVMLFDLHMPVINGLELTKRIMHIKPNSLIIIYTGFEIEPYFNKLVEAGVSGFVSKTATREQMIEAIRCTVRNETVIPIPLFKQLRRNSVRLCTGEDQLEEVSINEREQQILLEIAKGRSNKELSEILLMSQRNVEYQLTRIFGKLQVRSRAEAISEAIKRGIIPEQSW
ncbi:MULTISPECIES: response regulator transcription factor [Brevibacillus]|uniref:response regulator n=1 Tax=Brevibacillus TaxID=55080 RepID=UPI000D10802C|nr:MULTISPECIES: response regulator transcription factor [Brevibacillus]MED1948099.1 response regulator transcription factor [Brevibacillus formosus]MED1998170.1 response regulator transcription factor [Brevibacillus formosus]MED2080711.1 response regulator transcription factor [Brevibacillus formosus]PSK20615.1 DNA-binding response regulator [Brevibacillus sp. NRRL NRS-603]